MISRRKSLTLRCLGVKTHRPQGWCCMPIPFPSGHCHSTSVETNWVSFLSVAASCHSPFCLWTHPSQRSLSSATYIQPEGTASDTLCSSQRNQIPPNQIMFILQILTSFLHSIHELLHDRSFHFCFFLQKLFSKKKKTYFPSRG